MLNKNIIEFLFLKHLPYHLVRKRGKVKTMAGRKSKYSYNEWKENKKIWLAALYIRLSQEDSESRRRKIRK